MLFTDIKKKLLDLIERTRKFALDIVLMIIVVQFVKSSRREVNLRN